MKRWPIVALVLLSCHASRAADAPAPLKPGTGEEVASVTCNTCHTSDYIVMNSTFLTAEQWRVEVSRMRTAFGAQIDDAVAAKIETYLGAYYAAAAKP